MALFNITRYPSILVFLLAGAAAVIFAFVTYNLFSQAMASVDFLSRHTWDAIRFGGLWQVAELLLWGSLSLSCWLTFKICEQVLEDRYLDWAHRKRGGRKTATD